MMSESRDIPLVNTPSSSGHPTSAPLSRRAVGLGVLSMALVAVFGVAVGRASVSSPAQSKELTYEGKQQIFGAMMESWGSGAWAPANKDRMAEVTKFFTDDAQFHADGNIPHAGDMYKTYFGKKQILEWTDKLMAIQMPDFAVTLMADVPGSDKILFEISASIVVPATGKSTPKPVLNAGQVTFADGKIKDMKLWWGSDKEMDAAFTPGLTFDEKTAVGMQMVQNWGAGLWAPTNKDRLALAKAIIAPDAVFDVSSNAQSEAAQQLMKVYKGGPQGVLDWCDKLLDFEFPDFQVVGVNDGPGDTFNMQIMATAKYKPTGKVAAHAVSDIIQISVNKDKKISHVKYYWAEPAVFDAMMQ